MASPPPFALKTRAAVVQGPVLAAAVSIGALLLAAGPDRRVLGLAPAPFGWNRLIVIHALATLMASWYLARLLQERIAPPGKPRGRTFAWALLGLVVAGLTVVAGGLPERILDSLEAGYETRFLVRVVWCAVLQMPWCLAALAAQPAGAKPRCLFSPPHGLLLAGVTAVGIPASFLAVFVEQQTEMAIQAWRQERFAEARRYVQRLVDVGSRSSLGQRPGPSGRPGAVQVVTPRRALADLQNAVQFVQQQIGQTAAAEPTDRLRLARAHGYLALDKVSAAIAELEPVAARDPTAALTLAQIYARQGRTTASATWARKALELARAVKPAEAAAAKANREVQFRALKMLAVAAGEQADFKQAEAYLLEALDQFPEHQAEIHDRLGKHYEYIGELRRALAHQQRAAELAPDKYPRPEGMVAKMISTGAPVGLARPKSSRYK